MIKKPAVYITASKKNGTLYIGVTSNLIQRIWQHRQGQLAGFTKKYYVNQLVYFELHDDMTAALLREKQLKKWKRIWKIKLIEENNSEWIDLWHQIKQ